MQSGQANLIKELKELTESQKLTESVRVLTERVSTLESEFAGSETDARAFQRNVKAEIGELRKRCDDAESRSCRQNLLFFGIPDKEKECWAESESLVIDTCLRKRGVTLDASRIERAHRIGSFRPGRCRPILVKFSFFKDKELVLASGFKLKDSGLEVGEDFPKSEQLSRELLEFARAQESRFRLRVDRLQIGGKDYFFDHESGHVCKSGI